MADYSIYPNAIDGYAQLPLAIDDITPVNAFSVNTLRSAISLFILAKELLILGRQSPNLIR
tara:strand:+ start:894 stop:1076 length:183 start_codon:yes stop_codon:yes gene_type:complete